MPILTINGKQSDVDIEYELRLHEWNNARWTSSKLIASSPFRQDNAPSFFVNLDGEYAGAWGDSGATDEYGSGNFIKLLAYLRGTDEVEASDYLLNKYGILYEIREGETIKINAPTLKRPKVDIALIHTVTPAISPYLIGRGIGPTVQERFGIGYNARNKGYTAIPWHYHDTGAVANVKYRSTRGKRFFYEPDAKPISELVYGLWQAKGARTVVICEAEIDALSWEMAGYTSISLGGAHISDVQARLIIREGFERIILAGDNDAQGRKFNRKVAGKLDGYVGFSVINYDIMAQDKDANDVLLSRGISGLKALVDGAVEVYMLTLVSKIVKNN